jgi:BirA family biotin operon repressor/biotin-[acetyl-CoA-carboxylase] ligase
VNSTNPLAKELARAGAPEGTLVLAEEQYAGRGRMGRSWLSPKHANLLLSILLRPDMVVEKVFSLTMVLALATMDAVESVTGVRSVLKWPNDIYVREKKVAGILTEFAASGRRVDHVVLGLGINVNWSPKSQETLRYAATSLLTETGKLVSRELLLVELLRTFEAHYGDVLAGRIAEFHQQWNERSLILGRQVSVHSANSRIRGRALRIDENGALIISLRNGGEQKILYGDVSVTEIEDEPNEVDGQKDGARK